MNVIIVNDVEIGHYSDFDVFYNAVAGALHGLKDRLDAKEADTGHRPSVEVRLSVNGNGAVQ